MSDAHNPSASGHETDPDTDWKARYMQQIMDYLSVSISDFKIAIGPENKSMVVVGSDIDLVTENWKHKKEMRFLFCNE